MQSHQLFGTTQNTGMVSVAEGDLIGDGIDDNALGTNQDGSQMQVFHGGDFSKLIGSQASPAASYMGRTMLERGDLTRDERADLVVTSLYPGRSRAVDCDGTSLAPGVAPSDALSRFSLGGNYVSGLFLAVRDVNAEGHADLVLGSACTRSPNVTVYSGEDLVESGVRTKIANVTSEGAAAKTGVRVAVRNVNGDETADIPKVSGELVSAFHGGDLLTEGPPYSLFAFDPDLAKIGAVGFC